MSLGVPLNSSSKGLTRKKGKLSQMKCLGELLGSINIAWETKELNLVHWFSDSITGFFFYYFMTMIGTLNLFIPHLLSMTPLFPKAL